MIFRHCNPFKGEIELNRDQNPQDSSQKAIESIRSNSEHKIETEKEEFVNTSKDEPASLEDGPFKITRSNIIRISTCKLFSISLWF